MTCDLRLRNWGEYGRAGAGLPCRDRKGVSMRPSSGHILKDECHVGQALGLRGALSPASGPRLGTHTVTFDGAALGCPILWISQ